jgi:nicotinate phosphoribosyltransferase
MQQAVLRHFPDVQATYRFNHRDKGRLFSSRCVEQFRSSVSRQFQSSKLVALSVYLISGFSELSLTDSEMEWLGKACPFLKAPYIQYLSNFRFEPEQVNITFIPTTVDSEYGHLEIEATGLWVETIFWEVPLMACLSETFFQTVDTDWSYEGQAGELKCLSLTCLWSTFLIYVILKSLLSRKGRLFSKQAAYLASSELAEEGHTTFKISW